MEQKLLHDAVPVVSRKCDMKVDVAVQKRAYKLDVWEGPIDFLEQVARGAGVSRSAVPGMSNRD